MKKHQKLNRLCKWLEQQYQYVEDVAEGKQVYVKRINLRRAIQKLLMITDRHTIASWIDMLIAKEYITPNPHTELLPKKRGVQPKVRPCNDTRYFINISMIRNLTRPLSSFKASMPSKNHNGNL